MDCIDLASMNSPALLLDFAGSLINSLLAATPSPRPTTGGGSAGNLGPILGFAGATLGAVIAASAALWVRRKNQALEQSYPTLIYFNKVDRGGHFAAWEEPELFSDEVRAAFRSLREGRAS